MNVKKGIRDYLLKKKEAGSVVRIFSEGYRIVRKADEMGNKRLFRPSTYQVESFIKRCVESQQALEKYINDLRNREEIIIPEEISKKISNTEITQLIDCRDLGRAYCDIAEILRRQKKISMMHTPITMIDGQEIIPITPIEIVLITVVISIIVACIN